MTTSHPDTSPIDLRGDNHRGDKRRGADSPDLEPENLLPRFARHAEAVQYAQAAQEATATEVTPPIPLRPNIPDPRSRLSRWPALHLSAVLGIVLESMFVSLAIALAPFDGHPVIVTVLIVVFAVLPQRRRQRLTLSMLDDLPLMAAIVLLVSMSAIVIVAPSTTLLTAALISLSVLAATMAGREASYFVARRLRRRPRFQRRTVVIGSGLVATQLVESMQSYPEHGLEPHALLDDSPMPASVASHIPVEPLANQLRTYIDLHQIDTIVIAFSAMRESALLTLLRECDRMDCEIFVVPRLFEFVSVTGEMDRLHAIPLVRIRRDAHRSLAWRMKRVLSSILAGMALFVLSPLLLAIAAAVRFSDPSAPVLFKQLRVTGNGQLFACLKFRSMKPASRTESDTTWNISQDDRVGRLGRFLRKTSLDELPQLWNIMVGDMDLVGPRPERPHFVDKFTTEIPGYSARHRVPGGLTGWAAVHGLRGDTSLKDRALYDNFYIENWSLWLDVKILLRTVLSVLRRTGG
ncbi:MULTISPECIES: sugar transferase [unclassified Rhodococcus (in: high G+C Gram-positive bacteria)]|uniref:sugar transferase n=1 Tax=unclassified Rhodococcus (in: high G+C Gram-positive bacteria) TaxID=192944 RepID=UPI0006F34BE2|nr:MULTISPECIES: sugar transferase [unclassified Rhodococcus (in: high G+C Gram-positive bacteria)]KQU28338.1 hypothetical protein ASG69_09940 [Rhodococcus sp. Leaf225]KQU46445.1 hypothetical protein ASH03_06975 [Rhodococcus sp. Leaf258]